MYEGTDRVKQINWLNQEAGDILYYDQAGTCTKKDAAELVKFWRKQTEQPSWFDQSDYDWLVNAVSELLK